jgi:NAD(P)-dependent dehydrogenase (short-subunit alcohol dehydrogenase family)
MRLDLEEKVIVITGGTAGIGKACVDAFLAEGCQVAICARSAERLENFRNAYAGQPVLAIQADVSRAADMEHLATQTASYFGGIDVWVNNAGIYPKGYLAEMPLEEWQQTFDINVNGVLYGARAAIPHLKNRGKGVIINAASFATLMPTAGRGAYGITKAAVGHMTKVLGAELAPDNIRVVSYMPGFVATELTAPVITEYEGNQIKRQLAQNRYGRVEEIAPVVVFLASDAASFITGSGIEASGGKYCVQNPYVAWER